MKDKKEWEGKLTREQKELAKTILGNLRQTASAKASLLIKEEGNLILKGVDVEFDNLVKAIRSLLKSQRQELIKKVEGMKKSNFVNDKIMSFIECRQKEIEKYGYSSFDREFGYNQALDDVLARLEKLVKGGE